MVKEVTAAVTRRSQGDPTSFTLESVFGSVKPAASTTDFDAIIRAAKDDKARRTMDA